jgi:hypothetical protein
MGAPMSERDLPLSKRDASLSWGGGPPRRGGSRMSEKGMPLSKRDASLSWGGGPPFWGGSRMSEKGVPLSKRDASLSRGGGPPRRGGSRMSEKDVPPSQRDAPPFWGGSRMSEKGVPLSKGDSTLANVTSGHAPARRSSPSDRAVRKGRRGRCAGRAFPGPTGRSKHERPGSLRAKATSGGRRGLRVEGDAAARLADHRWHVRRELRGGAPERGNGLAEPTLGVADVNALTKRRSRLRA